MNQIKYKYVIIGRHAQNERDVLSIITVTNLSEQKIFLQWQFITSSVDFS